MVTQTITINLTQSRLAPIIMRSEEKGREIQFDVIDEAGEPADLTDYSLKYMQIKPDGNVIYADLTSGILTQTEQMTTSKGKGYYCIRISDDDTIIYSGQGPVVIDDHVIDDETLESISEVNGLIFPDDFLTSDDLDGYVTDDELSTALNDYVTDSGLSEVLEDYATEDYVDTAIAGVHPYSETVLMDAPIIPAGTSSIEIGESIFDFDEIVFLVSNSDADLFSTPSLKPSLIEINKDYIMESFGVSHVGAFINVTNIDGKHINLMRIASANNIIYHKIIGIKY